MVKTTKTDCRNMAIRLANEAVEFAVAAQRRALLIDELTKLFNEASALILEEERKKVLLVDFKNSVEMECAAAEDFYAENTTFGFFPLSNDVGTENVAYSDSAPLLQAAQGPLPDDAVSFLSLEGLPTVSDHNASCHDDELHREDAFSDHADPHDPAPHDPAHQHNVDISFDESEIQVYGNGLVHDDDLTSGDCNHTSDDAINDHFGEHLEFNLSTASKMHCGGNVALESRDSAIGNDISLTITEDASQYATNHSLYVENNNSESCDCSSVPLTPEEVIRDFQDLLSFTVTENRDELDNISSLIKDMVTCICDCWIDIPPIAPSPTPPSFSNGGKELDNTFTFQYKLPMVASPEIATHYALKPCSWLLYMSLTFYTCVDLVCISAVRAGQELHLLSLSWDDFSSMCFSCEFGVRVFLRFHGVFSSLLICKSRFICPT